jgi:hypothetical protein
MLSVFGKLRNSLWGFRVALTAIVLMASVSALRLSFNLGYHYELFLCVYPSLSPDAPFFTQLKWALSFEGEKFLLVTLALVFAALGLWTRRVFGFLISLIALACLAGIYLLWYRATLSMMETIGFKDFSQWTIQPQHILPLAEATWWDIVVLGAALLVFIWQAVMLKRILKPVPVISEKKPTAESD